MSTALRVERIAATGLREMSFSVEAGQCVGLLGESNSGIHAVRDIVTGTLPLVSGDLWLGDTQFSTANSRERKRMLAAVHVISAPEQIGRAHV